jgi:hypothetical protein
MLPDRATAERTSTQRKVTANSGRKLSAGPRQAGMPAMLARLQGEAGNHAVARFMRRRAVIGPGRAVVQRAPVEGKVREYASFGDWFFAKLDANKDELFLTVQGREADRFVWDHTQVTAAKDAGHFREHEHLHLIDKGTDVAISTKHTAPAPEARTGGFVRESNAAKKSRQGQHLTGLQALAGGQAAVTICTKERVPAGVPAWEAETVELLREMTETWLRDDATNEQLRQFKA